MNEYPRASDWLNTVLAGISGVNTICEHPVPQGQPYPAITWSVQASDDMTVVGESRVWAEFLMLVTAVDQTRSTLALQSIADAIDLALHGTTGDVADASVISSVRISPFQDSDIADGVPYRRLGGLYSLLVQPLPAP